MTCDIGRLEQAEATSRESMIARAMRAAGMAPLSLTLTAAAASSPAEPESEPVEGLVLVARKGGELLGTGTLVGHWVYDLYVEPACWRQGIGRLILMQLEAHASRIQARCLGLFAALQSVGFYERCGYAQHGQGLMLHGKAAVEMHKRLRP